ncbi:MAG: aminotransferase class I/II-fold pyridoxal phosphate-dependent enzyme [Paracoccaceae bacterium]
MYYYGQEEIDALEKVIRSGILFRYHEGSQCELFEERYSKFLGTKHFTLAVSGSYALSAGLMGLGVGPGDEVLIPAHTYMATATSVLAVGAIPVIVDIDETVTISPKAIRAAIGPRTKAIIPVHMWGAACDMDEIMAIADEHNLFVLEDACQGVGGSYKGRKLGSIGHAGAFSFNYFKNMSCGEGGGLATSDPKIAERVRCAIDPCHYYWTGRSDAIKPFASNGARASEFMGALLNVQLDRIEGLIGNMRTEKNRILSKTAALGNLGLKQSPMNSGDHDCATHVMYLMPTAEAADEFVKVFPAVIAGKTGRHTYTEWDQVLQHEGAFHPVLNPYNLAENRECRKDYSRDMCAGSLDILARTVMVPTDPLRSAQATDDIIHDIGEAARVALTDATIATAMTRTSGAVDIQKYT